MSDFCKNRRRSRFDRLKLGTICFLLVVICGVLRSRAAEEESAAAAPIQVAFSGSMFADVNENDASAAVRIWAQMLGNDRGIPVNPIVKILRGSNEIAQSLQSRSVDVITLTSEECWALKTATPFGSFVYGVRDGQVTEEYVLLVQQDSPFKQLSDLSGHTLSVFSNPRASLARIWLETELRRGGKGCLPEFFGHITQFSKLTKAMLPVYFGQIDACLITRQGFEIASELNPQVGRKLKVLAASQPLVPVVFCFRDDYRSPYRSRLLTAIGAVKTTPAGQQFMTLFQCDNLREGPASLMESAFSLLEAHAGLTRPASGAIAQSNLASPDAGARVSGTGTGKEANP